MTHMGSTIAPFFNSTTLPSSLSSTIPPSLDNSDSVFKWWVEGLLLTTVSSLGILGNIGR